MTYIVKIRPKSDTLISLLKQIKELAANDPDIEIEEVTEQDELTEAQRHELASRLEYVRQHPDEGILWEELMTKLWLND